ncbi:MAG: hypothetical protein V3U48_04375 [Rhodospirillales bacterium]
MRTLILAGAIIALVTTPAFACRGTVEYPEAADGIAQSTLTPERKKELLDQLNVGNALHKESHREGDMRKMGDSIRILDGIKAQTGK